MSEAKKHTCFVIGPIGTPNSQARRDADLLLKDIVRPALEGSAPSYVVTRADEDPRPGMIASRVIKDVVAADLVVADLTTFNPNVFYELAIRHVARKHTIHIMCISDLPPALPFDVAGYGTIYVNLNIWESKDDARRSIAASVRAINELSHPVSNPVTQALLELELESSGRTQDQKMLQLLEEIIGRITALFSMTASTSRGLPHFIKIAVAEAIKNGVEPFKIDSSEPAMPPFRAPKPGDDC